MLDSKSFNSALHDLALNEDQFIKVLDRIIKMIISIMNNTEELQEEILDYDYIYQILITDIDFNFWLKVSKGSIIYGEGINKKSTFKVMYTKDLLIKVLKREIHGTDAYIKGKIKIDGDLSQGLRFMKVFRLLLSYLDNGFKKKKR